MPPVIGSAFEVPTVTVLCLEAVTVNVYATFAERPDRSTDVSVVVLAAGPLGAAFTVYVYPVPALGQETWMLPAAATLGLSA